MSRSETEYRTYLKTKYKENGLSSLSEREVLELVLFYSMPAAGVKQCADNLTERFGSLGGVFSATYSSLIEVPGMTEKAAAFIRLIPQMCVQYSKSGAKSGVLSDMKQIRSFFVSQFLGLNHEVVKIACLDKKLNVIHTCTIAGGETSSVMINARLLVSEVINSGCVGCILAHNHPLGNCKPSQEDLALTKGIRSLLHTVNVRLFDHIVVGNDGVWSIKTEGKI